MCFTGCVILTSSVGEVLCAVSRSEQFYSNYNYYSTQSYSFEVNQLNLPAHATYHYRIVAFNLAGESFGEDQIFVVPP